MKKFVPFCLFVFSWFVFSLSAVDYDLSQIKVTASAPQHVFACQELQKHLVLAGAPEKAPAKGQLEIIIGRPGSATPLKEGESRYLFQQNQLFIWGDDNETFKRQGTLSGVYAFLENKLKVKWLFPGDEGIVIAPVGKISFKEGETFSFIPPLKWGAVRGYHGESAFQSYVHAPGALRKSEADEKKFAEDVRTFLRRQRQGRVNRPRYGHAFIQWPDRYWKKHSEYFGMDEKGKRTLPANKTRAKLCLSNPAVIDQIIAEWVQNGKPETINICPNDGTPGFCRCPGCMKLDARKEGEDFYAHLTDRYLNFWNRFLKKAKELRPDVVAVTYVYSYYRHPPRREKIQYPDNLLCGLVPRLGEDSKELFEAWQKAGMKNSFLRPNDLCYRSQIMRFMEKRIYDKFQSTRRAFKLHGADYDAGAWVPALDLESYTAVRMIAFPEESFEKIVADYCSGFGAAAGAVRKFYDTMRPCGERMYNEWYNKNLQKILDDSQVKTSAADFYLKALEKALKELQQFPESSLSEAEKKRFRRLKLTAEHSLLVSLFMQEGELKVKGRKNRLEEAAKTLWDFRHGSGKALPICWGRAFSMEELRFWELTSLYHKEVLKDGLDVDDPEAGWVNNFDNGLMQGWRKRNGFAKLSGQSVETLPLKQETYVISKHGIPVTPGAAYTLSFEAKAPRGAAFRLRVRQDAPKDLCTLRIVSKNGKWQKSSGTFTVPAGCRSITIYCCAGKTATGGLIDNIVLKRVKK